MSEKSKKWNKLAYVGAFAGHPSGKFEMTPQTFSEIEKNFRREGLDVVFDFEHSSEIPVSDSVSKARGESIASGWIKDVQARPDGLYGLVEWTDKARDMIKSGEIKYISPAIRLNSLDKVTGKPIGAKLSSAALCQKPFLSSLPPALASDSESTAFLCSEITGAELVELTAGGYAMHQNQFLPAFRRMLGLDDLSSPGDMLEKVDRLSELCDMADGDPSATVEGVNLGNYIPSIRQFMAMPANTTLGDLLEAVAEMIGSTIDCDDDSTGADMSDTVSVEAQIPTTLTAPVITQPETKNIMDANTITLSDHEAKVTSAVASAVTAEVAKATAPLTLQLSDVRSSLEVALADKAKADAKIVELSDQIAKQAADVSSARVEEAYETYKETKKLSDDDKAAMPIVLATNPALFDKLYPKVSPAKAVLLRTLSTDTSVSTVISGAKIVPDLNKLLSDVQSANPKKTFDECFTMALAEQTKLMAG